MSLLRADEFEKLQRYIVTYYESQAATPNKAASSGKIAASRFEWHLPALACSIVIGLGVFAIGSSQRSASALLLAWLSRPLSLPLSFLV
ncbi:MAG TPA: hypothetical protein VF026_19740 [Ktedonobacteraceae bacterium]